jgi:hypothetical protein
MWALGDGRVFLNLYMVRKSEDFERYSMGVPLSARPALENALDFIEQAVRDGVEHGHFEYTIRCELANGGSRRLTVACGKSHQFVIRPDDLPKTKQRNSDSQEGGARLRLTSLTIGENSEAATPNPANQSPA